MFFIVNSYGVSAEPSLSVNGIVSNVARRNPVKKNLICAIVFSVLSCTWLGVAGGVTGIIALDKQARADRKNKIVDAQ